ncbi:MAG: hypothetical protein HY454_01795 [Parcubacteria group bacterium]|nr:hypothetical protein [Parcubacteria group bacterium]
MDANPITNLVISHFGRDNIAQEAVSFVLKSLKSKSVVKSAAIALETLGYAAFGSGVDGPNERQIASGVEKVRVLLEKNGLSEVDPAKFFAGVLISAKYLHENKSALDGLKRLL